MRFICIALFCFLASGTASAEPTRFEINRANAVACVAAIQAIDKTMSLKLWSGRCKADEVSVIEAEEYGSEAASVAGRIVDKWSSAAPIVLKGEACAKADKRLTDHAGCGFATRGLIDALDRAEVLIPLPGGRCVRYVPLMLSDKTSAFSCTALRARRACVQVAADTDATVITLSTLPDGKGLTERFEISRAQADRWEKSNTYGSLSGRIPHDDIKTGQLYLIRAGAPVRVKEDKPPQLVQRIKLAAERSYKTCIERNANRQDRQVWCGHQRQFDGERIALEAVRVDLNIRHALSEDGRAQSAKGFMSYMDAQKASLSREEWALYNVIVYNEISLFPDRDGAKVAPYASPYQMLDAVYNNSSLSWGAKQIDFWGNQGDDINSFWKAAGKSENDIPSSFLDLKACLSNPGKTFPILALRRVFNEHSRWNASFDSAAMRAFHDAEFLAYIKGSVSDVAKLSGSSRLLGKSLLARVYYLDQVNQKGPKLAKGIIEIARDIEISATPSEPELCRAEAKLFKDYNSYLATKNVDPYVERQEKLAAVINHLDERASAPCKTMQGKA